jgi:glycosyltransferase involved in cell wall biosynthesis
MAQARAALTMEGSRTGRVHVLEILGNAIVGGMETFVTRLVHALPAESFRVSALCPFESHVTDALREAGADIIVAPVRDDPVWLTVQLAAAFVEDEAVHVLHAHLANAHVLGSLVSALTGRPCVATIHGRTVPMLDFEAHRMTDAMHMSVVCRAAYGHARAIGVARDRLHLIANGVPVTGASSASTAFAASLGVASDAPLVGFVGRLSPEKAPDLFVRMAHQLGAKHTRAAFVLIGDGPMRERLEEEVRLLGIAERVRFAGERRDVLPLLPSLTALVVPSHAEGMPLALMEAMAAGLPVVATSVGGIPEMIQHLSTGLLVPPGDAGQLAIAVDGLLDDPPWAAAIGARARQRACALWPQRESALRMGALLQALASAVPESARTRPVAPARVRLAGRVASTPGSR